MPGLTITRRRHGFTRKKMLDWELLTIIGYQVFVLRMALLLRVVEKRYFQQKKKKIPYQDIGYSDLISYLSSIEGIAVTMNSTNGQYQVEADSHQEFTNLLLVYFYQYGDDLI
ncbi:uncharacterized protein [Halyomorpha halys]|nr:uncharacterized protein LOC106684071 isoform X3 [Halyomorpha halys]XP_014281435.1 uncharacterized protein LOC106684071 isoform X3 [Halyomorpha halys]XP_014281444.1 uncharacterized protein LOC106684071 isoform X3 [Halyomorpha halys]